MIPKTIWRVSVPGGSSPFYVDDEEKLAGCLRFLREYYPVTVVRYDMASPLEEYGKVIP